MPNANKNQNQTQNPTGIAGELPMIQQRFALRRRMSSTALADVYWANDLHATTLSTPEHLVLIILVAPVISIIPGFSTVWQQVMSRPAPPANAYPDIVAWGEDKGSYWLACDNTRGMLLNEYLDTELDERGMPTEQALEMVQAIVDATNNVQAGAFGYLEPGAILRTDHGYTVLNAPLVKIMHQLLNQKNNTRHPLALHSAWLSPSVAVGDVPVPEDDTFSAAALLHTLLSHSPPYGQQSTLAAAARGDAPAASRKLKAEGQQILSAGLSLQRNQRPESPAELLGAIARKNKRKVLFPLALLAAIGVVAYASYHLLSKFDNLFNELPTHAETASPAPTDAARGIAPDTQGIAPPIGSTDADNPAKADDPAIALINENELAKPPSLEPALAATGTTTAGTAPAQEVGQTEVTGQNSSQPPQAEQDIAPANPEAAPVLAETSPTTPATAAQEPSSTQQSAQQTDITRLILQATEAFDAGRVEPGQAGGTDNALALLRQAWTLDQQNPNTRALLNKVLGKSQQQTESLLNQSNIEAAKQSLAKTDELIREFVLTDRIEEQVRLESLIEIHEREQKEAEDLLQQARNAIKKGRLTKDDGSNDNALAHLNKLMFMLPNHPEGRSLLEEIVEKRQAGIKKQLNRNQLEQAGTYLGETDRLIRKYNLVNRRQEQNELEQTYQSAMNAQPEPITPQAPSPALGEAQQPVMVEGLPPIPSSLPAEPVGQPPAVMVEGLPPIQTSIPAPEQAAPTEAVLVEGLPPIPGSIPTPEAVAPVEAQTEPLPLPIEALPFSTTGVLTTPEARSEQQLERTPQPRPPVQQNPRPQQRPPQQIMQAPEGQAVEAMQQVQQEQPAPQNAVMGPEAQATIEPPMQEAPQPEPVVIEAPAQIIMPEQVPVMVEEPAQQQGQAPQPLDEATQQSTQEPMQELVLPADATNQLPLELPADAVLPADMPQQYPAVLPVEEQLIPDSEHK